MVIPAYQAAWSIGDTIQSVLMQTQPAEEILIIDDGSTDDLHAVVQQASAGDHRVRIISQANQGLAGARNRGLAEARWDLVAFLDADDVWHPRFLELTAAKLAEHPDAPFAFAYSFRFGVDNSAVPHEPWPRAPRHDLIGLLTLNSVGNGSAALFRAELVRRCGGFDEAPRRVGLHGAEDWKLVLALAALGDPVLVPKPLVGYRQVSTSMSQSRPMSQLAAVRRVIEEVHVAHPELAARHFADANTMMTGWLFAALIRHAHPITVLRLFARAYLGNPGWIRSADLRTLHWRKLVEIAAAALPSFFPHRRARPLAAMIIDGERPFAFLESSATPARFLARSSR